MPPSRVVSLAVICAFGVGLPLGGQSIPAQNPRAPNPECVVVDKANPKEQRGRHVEPDYKFTHISDVDAGADQVNRVKQVLQNDHSTALLPADWPKAEIGFKRIRPGGCGLSEFPTPLVFQLDPTGVVRYDPLLKQAKPNVPTYVRAGAQSTVVPTSMTSRLYVQLESRTVDLRFTSRVEGRDYGYELQNSGSGEVTVTVAAVSQRWAALNVQPTIDWPRADGGVANAFRVVPSSQPVVMRFQVPGTVAVTPAIVQLRVIDPEGPAQPLAAGPVSVHLPAQ